MDKLKVCVNPKCFVYGCNDKCCKSCKARKCPFRNAPKKAVEDYEKVFITCPECVRGENYERFVL